MTLTPPARRRPWGHSGLPKTPIVGAGHTPAATTLRWEGRAAAKYVLLFRSLLVLRFHRAIPHNSKCRYGERGAADAKPKAQIILDAAKVSAASGGYSEPKQGQRSQSARGFCPRSTMRVPQPDIIEHFGNADAVPHTEPQRGASERNRRLRRLLARRSAAAVLKPSGGNCAVFP